MEMDFIDINEANLALANLLKPSLKIGDKLGALCRLGFAQDFFALFPTEARLFQECLRSVRLTVRCSFSATQRP